MMRDAILRHFPPDSPLILVSDPDALLADERVLVALQDRGFTLIPARDPLLLRRRYAESAPPCLVITPGPLAELPYDLWQQGQHVVLALHTFFPNLAYPLVQTLTPSQRARLFTAPPPDGRLGEAATVAHLFRHVFALDLDVLGDPYVFVNWLSTIGRGEPLPAPCRAALRARLDSLEAYRTWPLDELLDHPHRLDDLLQGQWQAYLQQRGLLRLGETAAGYLVDFNQPRWQDALPRWLRADLLQPVAVDAAPAGEPWLAAGVLVRAESARLKRLHLLLDAVEERLAPGVPEAFADWAALAQQWAELSALRHHPQADLTGAEVDRYSVLQTQLDLNCADWLVRAYPALAVNILPAPHHLFHVPQYLAAQRRRGAVDRLALIVLDGMALADWLVLWEGWGLRHRWRAETRLLLAQIPTVTAISRQALISGRRPAEFADTITHNRAEVRHWQHFWRGEGLGAHACLYTRDLRALPPSPDVQVCCLVFTIVDELHHRALLGPEEAQASLRRWRDHHAAAFEATLDALLAAGFAVWLTSDHGATAAVGIGQPSEGQIVETRSLRARTYRDALLAQAVQRDFPATHLWCDDGLLPADLWALMPQSRGAFAPADEIHITHGGLSLEEVFVPLVRIYREMG